MKKLANYTMCIFFFGFISVFFILDVILPDKTFSEIENRELAAMPKITLSGLLNNSFSSQSETFLNDHFLLRDEWITVKSMAETALFKTENNGIAYGKDSYLFEKDQSSLVPYLERNKERIVNFISAYSDRNITVAIAPSAESVLTDKVPAGMPLYDQISAIKDLNERVVKEGGKALDIAAELSPHSDEYIYYRTDHHWTTDGAVIAGEAFLRLAGRELPNIADYERITIPDFLGTHYNKSKNWDAKPDEISLYNMDFYSVTVDGEAKASYYDSSKFGERDKYAAFLWGNAGITVLTRVPEPKSRLLIIKDSYANCLAPYLSRSYDEVVLIDLRSMTSNMSDYLSEQEFDDILLLYNFRSIGTDNNIAKLGY